MSERIEAGNTGPSHRKIEAGVAIGLGVFALIVIAGSLQVGVGWGAEGPRSGFFPFYVGWAILISSVINLIQAMGYDRNELFADWSQLRQVSSLVAPTAVYVFAVPAVGIYLSSMVLISGFMMWFGRYRPLFSVGIAIAVMVATYFTFEKWFLVPLPKGPIEDYFGL